MTELTKEQIAKFIKDIESEGMCDITDSQVELALRKLLACEQVAEKSINTIRLINKFYERYPLNTFASDSERAAALGYFMAGAELQCYGDFIIY
ncbi:hypothetical protein [Yersinia enterocolitica]|uniref:hypothetical protein n=1 Tax=Yersinia enterocolitica TaxID=630 RepID=UPI001F5A6198|nr:hypothetical protein [Yersinia enterocolitica]EKN5999527.1 hypothetical protein [Yersinia enterocolitica]